MLNGRTYIREQYDRMPYPPPADVVRNLNLKPLYLAPPAERVALLEGLLREISRWNMMDVAADGKYWRERIRAALGEG
jgi:hypothetical protein